MDEAAVCLRKAAEDMAKRYRQWAEKKKLPSGKFFSLTENLPAARNKLLASIPKKLYDTVLNDTPAAHREHLIPAGDADVDALPGLDPADCENLKIQHGPITKLESNASSAVGAREKPFATG